MLFKKISVIGLGYIGLPTAAAFANAMIEVIGIDTNKAIVDSVNKGEVHIIEPDLESAVKRAVASGYLRASTVTEEADAFLIAVPTPFKDGYVPDLSFIESVVDKICPVLKKGDIVILESTSPVGTTEKINKIMAEKRSDLKFFNNGTSHGDVHVAYCPERVLPGNVMNEIIENDRVIGGLNDTSSNYAKTLYEIIVKGKCLISDSRTAEMVKLTENSYRDLNIAFANELSIIADKLDINVWKLIELANHHPRVNILKPGPGVGGHCIAVDPWFIIDQNPNEAKLIKLSRGVNEYKSLWVEEKVEILANKYEKENQKKARVVCLGLTFKPDIDDIRESPALNIVRNLAKKGINVSAIDPNVKKEVVDNEDIKLIKIDNLAELADIIVILVSHSFFKEIKHSFVDKIVLDTCGLMD